MSASRTDEVFVDESNLNELLLKIAYQVRPEWKMNPEDIEFKEVRNGLTNRTIHGYSSNNTDPSDGILVRIYRPGSERIVSRDEEYKAIGLMSQQGLGPSPLLQFKNGICCQYLPGNCVSLLTLYKEEVWHKIAEAMAKMHLIQLDNQIHPEPFVFRKLRDMMNLLNRDYKSSIPSMTEQYLSKIPSWEAIDQEIIEMRDLVSNSIKSKLVYCHNDLNSGNIIYDASSDQIKFIDFEYVGANYQAYEIANYFNEFIGIYDASPLFYPSRQYQVNFVRVYLRKFGSSSSNLDERVEQMLNDVRVLTPVSHLMWAVWSLVEAQDSNVEFDLVNYAQLKFDQYFRTKQDLLV